jgi:alpha-aminoadipate/glutamate carrier protein LysW
MISCPECEGEVGVVDGLRPNEVLECPDCRTELEVVSVDPLLVALAPEVEEDWGE